MAEVFLSYAREDRARAELVARGLSAAGVEVFWDNEIPPGQTWADYIESKLSQCRALIVLWSEHSAKSQWVREEARLGRDKGVLIPAMIDGAQAPFGFGEVQAANLADWDGSLDHPAWKRFVDAVRAAAGREPPPPRTQPVMSAPPRSAQAPTSSNKKSGVPLWAWIAGGAVGVLLVLGVVGAVLEEQQTAPPVQTASVQPAMQQPAVAPPTTDGSPQAVILAQLQQAQMALAQQGFQMVGQPATGGLQQGQTWNVPAQFVAGFEYRVLGVCDRDCSDLDLVMYDASGAAILQDTGVSSQPMLAIAPNYTGAFTVQVQMYQCSVAPCYYALALYGRALQ